jgi:hypothetical protein
METRRTYLGNGNRSSNTKFSSAARNTRFTGQVFILKAHCDGLIALAQEVQKVIDLRCTILEAHSIILSRLQGNVESLIAHVGISATPKRKKNSPKKN